MKLYEVKGQKKFSFSCIYLWENLINHKKYVGQAQNFYVRMTRYKGGNYNPHMKNAIKKYGLENFEISILEKNVPIEDLDKREQYWMDFYKVCCPEYGYNICPIAGSCRGKSSWNKGITMSEEFKNHVSEGLLEYYSTHEVWNKGIPATTEAKEKNRISNTGEKNGMWGKHHTEETKKKISEKNKGRNNSRSKSIVCIETGEEYISMSKAAKALNTYTSAIKIAVDNPNRTCCGFHFKLKE